LNPVVLVLDELPRLGQNPQLGAYISAVFGSIENACKAILVDFCRHAFDGSGADVSACVLSRLGDFFGAGCHWLPATQLPVSSVWLFSAVEWSGADVSACEHRQHLACTASKQRHPIPAYKAECMFVESVGSDTSGGTYVALGGTGCIAGCAGCVRMVGAAGLGLVLVACTLQRLSAPRSRPSLVLLFAAELLLCRQLHSCVQAAHVLSLTCCFAVSVSCSAAAWCCACCRTSLTLAAASTAA
jgi:hypothetical protein